VKLAVTGLRGIPGVMGGVETHCEEMLPRVKALAPEIDITVFARAPYVKQPTYQHHGLSVVAVGSPSSVSTEAIIATFNSIVAARRAGADIIHIHAIGPALLAPLARLMGLRVVMTHHGEDYNRAKWGAVARFALRAGEQLGVRFANHVIAVSPSLTQRLKESFPQAAGRISYIPNGVPELPRGSGGVLLKFSLSPRRYILAVGRLVPEKGLHDLIAAHAISADPRKLVIVGATDHASEYAASLLGKASERVVFTGMQGRTTLRELFENAALFVMPSYHEGLPIAALEAGSCSVPMLLSDIQPNLDLDLSTAHYFRVGDVNSLACALMLPPETYNVDAAEFRRKFNWGDIAAHTSAIYRTLA
jgi:glycosyltransferase involved in cell wall biosynthesis